MLPSTNFNANVIPVIPPGVIKDNAAYLSTAIDLGSEAVNGAPFLTFAVQLGSIDADLATLKVVESDVLTNATTLGGAPVDVLDITASVTPGATDDNKIYLVTVDLSAPRKQYQQLQVTAGDGVAGTYLAAICYAVAPHTIQTNNNAAAIVAA